MRYRRFIKNLGRGAMVVFLIWIAVSFAEVNIKNTQHDPQYSRYNAFSMIAGCGEEGRTA